MYCFAANNLPDFTTLPLSTDLQEAPALLCVKISAALVPSLCQFCTMHHDFLFACLAPRVIGLWQEEFDVNISDFSDGPRTTIFGVGSTVGSVTQFLLEAFETSTVASIEIKPSGRSFSLLFDALVQMPFAYFASIFLSSADYYSVCIGRNLSRQPTAPAPTPTMRAPQIFDSDIDTSTLVEYNWMQRVWLASSSNTSSSLPGHTGASSLGLMSLLLKN
eukprot:TRINITY_DN1458_c0_g1_i1.p1 TRINITY_DN1458_c0_g1~~TRINITY_DN1458_c0_g1_i1.p1  ORF type:complete len:219 (+),score=27.81 TRINITY_DN1458_c0_g1_i1:47-703(+)